MLQVIRTRLGEWPSRSVDESGCSLTRIPHVTFVPLVMSATGGITKQATNFYKRLTSLLANKWEQPYSTTWYWLRCSLSFNLLRSAIQCIRGAQSSRGHAVKVTGTRLAHAVTLSMNMTIGTPRYVILRLRGLGLA